MTAKNTASPFVQPPVMLLAAGRGERMRPLTDVTPKPLLQVQGVPLLQHHMQSLVAAGVSRAVINTGWLGDQIPAHFGRQFVLQGNGEARQQLALVYSVEPEKAYETAGGISRIDIERTAKDVTVNIMTSKPGMIIGPKGATIEQLKAEVTKQLGRPAQINVMEIKQPDADAQLVAENIAQQLEKRISFRRALKQAQQRAMKLPGVKGIKTSVSGRLGGADIARTEHYHDGSIPLQTLRANIDYGFAEAKTTYGRLGVKVWIYKGQILPKAKKAPVAKEVK